jgi:hypothetical protein
MLLAACRLKRRTDSPTALVAKRGCYLKPRTIYGAGAPNAFAAFAAWVGWRAESFILWGDSHAGGLRAASRFDPDAAAQFRCECGYTCSVPEIGVNVPTAPAPAPITGTPVDVAPSDSEFLTRQQHTFQLLPRATVDCPARIVYPHEIFCDPMRCLVARDVGPLYSDDNHRSVHGAPYLRPLFDRLLKQGPSWLPAPRTIIA